jgi:putative salt-induced outer membrane protein YdiY
MSTMINNQKHARSRRVIALAAALVCASSGLALAQSEAPPAPAKTNHWETTAAASATLTRGNSQTFLATVSLDTKGKWEKDEAAFGISGGYGEAEVNDVNTKNMEFLQGYGQYDRLFTDRFYGALRLDGQYDEIAGVDYRFKVSPLAGYYLIKNDKMTLAAEGGPSLIVEHLKGEPSDSYWAARLAERFEYKLTTTTRVWETLEYLPKVDDWANNYLLNFEAGIDTAINKHWSLRVVFQDQYANEPAAGRKDNDIRLMAGTAYKF